MLKSKGLQTIKEPRISTPAGLRKPDIMAWNAAGAWVLDVQITSDANVRSLEDLHNLKVVKYSTNAVDVYVFAATGHHPVVSSVTFDWRGSAALATTRVLRNLGLTANDLTLLSVRILEKGSSIYANYMGTSGGGDVG